MNKEKIVIDNGHLIHYLNDHEFYEYDTLYTGTLDYITNLQQENKQLQQNYKSLEELILNTKKWLQLIIDLGFDYDGLNTVESLKSLIDELVQYARYGRDNYKYEDILIGDNNE